MLDAFAEILEPADVQVAQRLSTLSGTTDASVTLALALAVRALRGGSVCVDLRSVAEQTQLPELPWPAVDEWLAAVAASPLLGTPPVLRLFGDLLYLDRYWLEEQQVCDDVLTLVATKPGGSIPDVTRLFPPGFEEQRAAAKVALSQGLTVLTGGPGTGKTTTVARLLALLAEQAALAGHPPLRIALAAPTGKAAARLQEAVQLEVDRLDAVDRDRISGLQATTLHRLLGSRPDTSSRFRHHRGNRLPHDVIVVDETSMVSLTMMARLLEAVRPQTRLLLVGDPDQLASVEAGAVLADLVDGLGSRGVAALQTSHRFGESIGALASAIRAGDASGAVEVLSAGGEHVEWVSSQADERLREVLVPHALALRQAAVLGDAGTALDILDEHRLLCAHRSGPFGVAQWNRQVQRWLAEATGEPTWATWYVGRPILVTANDYGLKLYNGDTGVTVATPDGLRAVVGGSGTFATGRLTEVETMHAMTIHKSQGSQADEVTVLLPPEESRLLTRELFYTAVTRAKTRVRVVGSEAEIRAAIARQAVRATGLRKRLKL
ncbi:exodeoxyribonuclease V subunit alpha [Mycolicibacterium fortuitum]|jgi:exodeoxyribonuclease V alpha subunit|uniref:RecBCD enzyme subunit RecD n=2 Tax=Mycolicibacterium fortuitum TaxID=1766 RepID=A0AAE4VCS2_MYCFO|nr:exodeoxyribonuclease V subunit alpha [Mycolicibacterium fortuitum]MCV7142808.1 exodeoxyribonuclease V subunit alpha [Mycolicibacterium fortuitum]MDV7192491.1 exodeoxyribonuclease V subunit alpha [Mycolicibacterium fortuitum]MDV7205392.1 exodeoxyribonuclease V subunit alpha [Mycolicibacterium fortuitum]MDV7226973.1 exodeoxyribonuclease V subunit alpha [Mycolicibacterium fortuitum]MDV7259782.1 exodeoxyribonuclease V subunit alpha [Mycolicibacterium fortuitum]